MGTTHMNEDNTVQKLLTLFLPATHTAEPHADFFTFETFDLVFDSGDDKEDARRSRRRTGSSPRAPRRCSRVGPPVEPSWALATWPSTTAVASTRETRTPRAERF